ncbi:LuxR C-terminal-related transcriptional regulator [Paenibacillus thailandensis]|uniref:LuxR C-terminal-related transcriptional regulator n=1 Tax=Paenibacillus thailandensis TaxID=393250 RepID=A0ABW5QUZ4_9BACL
MERAGLAERLGKALETRLTAIVAPAGYGKSTLAGGWVRTAGLPAGWISLDEKDNDPVRFWRCLSGAAEQALGTAPAYVPEAAGSVRTEHLAETLLEALIGHSERSGSLLLVLDDYHVLQEERLHEAFYRWIIRLPRSVRIMLLSRHDIPFPLAALRAKGMLNELGMTDLRFTREEVADYWRLQTGEAPQEPFLRRLVAVTEGWAAMLHLSALSFAGKRAAGLDEAYPISGRSRHVSDYLFEEAFGGLPKETQRFLLRTSVLDRMNAGLAEAVSGVSAARRTMKELARKGLFMIPLDDDREWYRYHHLFRDFLRERLREESPAEEVRLHGIAAGWHAANGLWEEAVEHALRAGRAAEAAAWTLEHADVWLRHRETVALRRLLERLPKPEANEPGIVLLQLWTDLLDGRKGRAGSMLRELNAALGAMADRPAYGRMREEVRILENYCAVLEGDFDRALALIREYGERNDLPARDTPLLLGRGLELNEGAVPFIRGAFGFNGDVGKAGLYHRYYGKFIEKNGLHENAYTAYQQTAMAECRYMLGELPDARAYAEEGARLGRVFGALGAYVPAMILQSRLLAADRRLHGAADCMEEALEHLRQCRLHTTVWQRKLGARLAWIKLQLGDLDWARKWMKGRSGISCGTNGPAAADIGYPDDEDLIHARVAAGLGRTEEAMAAATAIREAAERRNNRLSMLEAELLLARLHAEGGDNAACARHLGESVKLAAPDRCYRPFLDEGAAIAERLKLLVSSSIGSSFTEEELRFIQALLHMARSKGTSVPDEAKLSYERLREPLTEKEKEVLTLMAMGLSNKSIAAELRVTEGTVKTHLHRIYAKLSANGRTHAVRLAKERGLLAP